MRLINADELIVMEYGGIKFVPKEFIDDAPTVNPFEIVTAYGYSVQELVALAMLCRKKGIEPCDIDSFFLAYQNAHQLALEDFKKQIREMFSGRKEEQG